MPRKSIVFFSTGRSLTSTPSAALSGSTLDLFPPPSSSSSLVSSPPPSPVSTTSFFSPYFFLSFSSPSFPYLHEDSTPSSLSTASALSNRTWPFLSLTLSQPQNWFISSSGPKGPPGDSGTGSSRTPSLTPGAAFRSLSSALVCGVSAGRSLFSSVSGTGG